MNGNKENNKKSTEKEKSIDEIFHKSEGEVFWTTFKKAAIVAVILLFVAGLIATISRRSGEKIAQQERKLARETAVETVEETRSEEEKESLQEKFNTAVAKEASQAAAAIKGSKIFQIAVVGASRGVDFGKKIFRGDYINGYPVSEDSYAMEVPYGFELAKVRRVVDGDTLLVEFVGSNGTKLDGENISGKEAYVRLLNINTPESVAPDEYLKKTGKENSVEGKEASEYVKSIVKSGDVIYLSPDPAENADDMDKYGRYLRMVWTQSDPAKLDVFDEDCIRQGTLNAKIILEGMAEAIAVGANKTYEDLFRSLQSEAMRNEAGLWEWKE